MGIIEPPLKNQLGFHNYQSQGLPPQIYAELAHSQTRQFGNYEMLQTGIENGLYQEKCRQEHICKVEKVFDEKTAHKTIAHLVGYQD